MYLLIKKKKNTKKPHDRLNTANIQPLMFTILGWTPKILKVYFYILYLEFKTFTIETKSQNTFH